MSNRQAHGATSQHLRLIKTFAFSLVCFLLVQAVGGLFLFAFSPKQAWAANSFSLSFDGLDDYVDAGDSSELRIMGSVTLEAWAKHTQFRDAGNESLGGVLVSYGDNQDLTNNNVAYAMGINASKQLTIFWEHGSGVNDGAQSEVLPIETGEWHHFAVVREWTGSTNNISFFLDGRQVGATVQDPDQADNTGTGTSLFIGGLRDGEEDYWHNGLIDEVRIWNTARTQEEIQQNMNSEIESAAGLVARWGFNEGSGTVAKDSAGTNDGTISGASWVEGYSFNQAPDQPNLNSPPDGSFVSLSPTLNVSVSDPDEDELTVQFYGRQYCEAENDFTIVVLPDTQNYSTSYPEIFAAQTEWIVENATSSLNIQMVLHEGDVVNDGDSATEWSNAMAALNTLNDNNIPNLISLGNHDYDDDALTRSSLFFNNNIDYDTWYADKSWFNGGAYEPGKSDNVYTRLNIGSLRYLFMTLEFGPRQGVIDWANQVISENPEYQVVIVTHTYMYSDDTRHGSGDSWNPHDYGIGADAHDGEEMWTELVKLHGNVFLVVNGHVLNDGLGQLTSTGDNGNSVHQILANYQMEPNGGNGWLRYYTFKPSEDKIYAYTYSPTLDQFDTSADNQFVLDYDFETCASYENLASVSGLSSGSRATYVWSTTIEGTRYQWYATAYDGNSTTASSVWTFSTSWGDIYNIFRNVINTAYSQGYVTYDAEPNESDLVSLSVVPSSGSVDISIDTWRTADDYYKKWTATASGALSVEHTVGDLKPTTEYDVKVDGAVYNTYTSNSSGEITFTYAGAFSSHTFEIEEHVAFSRFSRTRTYSGGAGTVSPRKTVTIRRTLGSGQVARAVFPRDSVPGTIEAAIELEDIEQVTRDKPLPENKQMIGDLMGDFRVLTAGVTEFLSPVTVSFTYSDAQIQEAQAEEQDLAIYRYNEDSQTWEALESTVDTSSNTVSALTSHFTLFGVLADVPGKDEKEPEPGRETPTLGDEGKQEEPSGSPEKPISEMTAEELKAKITELQEQLIQLLAQLLQLLQEQLSQFRGA